MNNKTFADKNTAWQGTLPNFFTCPICKKRIVTRYQYKPNHVCIPKKKGGELSE